MRDTDRFFPQFNVCSVGWVPEPAMQLHLPMHKLYVLIFVLLVPKAYLFMRNRPYRFPFFEEYPPTNWFPLCRVCIDHNFRAGRIYLILELILWHLFVGSLQLLLLYLIHSRVILKHRSPLIRPRIVFWEGDGLMTLQE